MSVLYAINPLILSDKLPSPGTVEYNVSTYFYLFKVYSINYFQIKNYMTFINANFDNAFDKLGYQIIQYEYPDYLDDEVSILTWINEKHGLTDNYELFIWNKLEKDLVYDYGSKKKYYVYLSTTAKNEFLSLYCDCVNFDISIESILYYANYIVDKDTKDIIKACIYRYYDYENVIEQYLAPDDGIFNSYMISSPIMNLICLKQFVKYAGGY